MERQRLKGFRLHGALPLPRPTPRPGAEAPGPRATLELSKGFYASKFPVAETAKKMSALLASRTPWNAPLRQVLDAPLLPEVQGVKLRQQECKPTI